MDAIATATAIANAITGMSGVVKPVLDEAIAQRHESAMRKRLRDFTEIMAQADDARRADGVRDFVSGLCADSGVPFITLAPGPGFVIPMEAFAALISIAAQSIRYREDLASIQFKTQ